MNLAWPTFNACMNGASAVCLGAGYWFIRRGDRGRHRASMILAALFSAVFLVSYLAYHAKVGDVHFLGQGWIRPVYFTILITHVVLALSVPVFAVLLLTWAFQGKFSRHKALARWAWPIWMYVSVTGVVVYLMLYTMKFS